MARTHVPASLRLRDAWRMASSSPLRAGLLAGSLGAATVQRSTASLGSDWFCYDYVVSGIVFQPYQVLSTPLSVTILVFGAGTPGAQPFFVNQPSQDNGQIVSSIVSGRTTSAVPEPAGWSLDGLGLIVCGVAWPVRHRLRRTASQ